MPKRPMLAVILLAVAGCGDGGDPDGGGLAAEVGSMQALGGFVDLYWDEAGGRLLLAIPAFDEDFLYQSALARGVGSNDLGLDRGQLGATRIVRFERSGPKVLLVEENLQYRASGENAAERQAVRESFARSVVWGFEALGEYAGATVVDATAFFLRDAHEVAARLAEAGEGTYQPDSARSAIYLPRTKAFPDNTEIEAVVTYTGKPAGEWLRTVVPDATQFTVHLHHSFIRLPGPGYEPLPYDPRAGLIGLRYGDSGFLDYANPVDEPLAVGYARRHRLEKRDPSAETSEAVEPIVYYVDRGAPEPVRSALIEGASWWNQAFAAAGYQDAFRVELLPEDADPMDVRYNVIQWVHRSTRGWSYGSSILDPRSGEILKGLVTLGSLRIRQDYMIAEGLLGPYEGETVPDDMLEMSLARIRQLSAHEVGHTLGFEHNFAASTQDRASVMDYPFPLITIGGDGELDLSRAYDTGIGEWDIRTVLYGYQDFPGGVDRAAERDRIMQETIAAGWKFVADQHSRDVGSAHPDGNLWDNGADAIAELERLLRVRAIALERFGERNLETGQPLATLQDVLVPIYLLHRYQLQAVGKLLGGQYFNYALRGDGQAATRLVEPARQRAAIDALVGTLAPAVLRLPASLADRVPPRPPGFPETRELFASQTGDVFDPLAPAASGAALTLEVLLEPTRAARMNAAHARRSEAPGFGELLDALLNATWFDAPGSGVDGALQRAVNGQVLLRMMQLAVSNAVDRGVQALALAGVDRLDDRLAERSARAPDDSWRAHYEQARFAIRGMHEDPAGVAGLPLPEPPPGSPIGQAR